MWVVTVLVLLAGGLLGASNIVLGKRPDAKPLIDKLTPYQGYIGVILLIWGVIDLINFLRALGAFGAAPFLMLIFLLVVVCELGLGFLLGYGLIMKFVGGKSPEATAKAEQVRAKLLPYQGPLGLTAIVLVVVYLILCIRYY